MPLISIRLKAGRPREELEDLVRGVSEAAAQALEVPVEGIGVHLFELAPDRVARGGRLGGDPAGEA
jgi:phenylpyruvate tautomerase PptA (4-oxalocrotonate tautomerase family)